MSAMQMQKVVVPARHYKKKDFKNTVKMFFFSCSRLLLGGGEIKNKICIYEKKVKKKRVAHKANKEGTLIFMGRFLPKKKGTLMMKILLTPSCCQMGFPSPHLRRDY
eukprot:TRINITY_DN3154_c2_g1_i2.p1 TRINITY_DN3154_c2_g1~~TRINITY_DN3154_c2_g1_i2.p1  ORF type:complete len:107 (+),score=1.99 TRINITY_DN3154_c2_g1_i2:705-1025(+)